MTTQHQFIRICDLNKATSSTGVVRGIPGAEVMCAVCGQVKSMFADGSIEVTVLGDSEKHAETV